jgi:acyl-coenzyme A thioesterase PaaI-like protein
LGKPYPTHIVHELGFDLGRVGEEIHGSAPIVAEMYAPGSTTVRASIFATWTDIAAGYLALDAFAPRVPTTLELDVHLHQHSGEFAQVQVVARLIKSGRSVMVAMVDFTDETGTNVAFGTASFMPVPDATMRIPPEHEAFRAERRRPGRLRQPFAERAGCVRQSPGVAVLPRSEDGLNSSRTVNGGLIALAVEEAVLSATPGASVSSLAMRYLRPVRMGPAIATAQVSDGLGRVEVRDGGSDDRLAVYAITRTASITGAASEDAAA